MNATTQRRLLPLLSIVMATFTGCSGGGSDDSFVGAADVSIMTQPSTIDSGDRTEVMTEVSNVHENGIALKFRFPDGLKYVKSSAFLLVESKEIDLTPVVNAVSSDGDRYLVFFIAQSSFKTSGQEYNGESATVALQLEGIDAVTNGLIEVDPDVDDPLQDNGTEFSIDTPEFNAQAETSIAVVAE